MLGRQLGGLPSPVADTCPQGPVVDKGGCPPRLPRGGADEAALQWASALPPPSRTRSPARSQAACPLVNCSFPKRSPIVPPLVRGLLLLFVLFPRLQAARPGPHVAGPGRGTAMFTSRSPAQRQGITPLPCMSS